MTISNHDEFRLKIGYVVSIQFSVEGNCWEVACWNTDDTALWYKEFDNEEKARAEYNKWKENDE